MRRPVLVATCLAAALASPVAALAGPADPDPSFGTGGNAQPVLGPAYATALDVAVQADGRLLLAGAALATAPSDGTNPATYPNARRPAIARLTATGALDPGFDGDGVAMGAGQPGSEARGVAAGPGGTVVTTGTSAARGGQLVVERRTAAGVLDPSFATGGRFASALGTTAAQGNAVLVLPDGGVLVAGRAEPEGAGRVGALLKLTAGGTPDPAFGVDGVRLQDLGDGDETRFEDLAVDPAGRVHVAGATELGGRDRLLWARFSPAGALQAQGSSTAGSTTATAAGAAVAVDASGRAVVAGQLGAGPEARALVTRFDASGGFDSTFGPAGARLTAVPGASSYRDLALRPDGSLLLAGEATQGTRQGLLVALTPSGTPDPAFGGDGARTYSSGDAGSAFAALALVGNRTRAIAAGEAVTGTTTRALVTKVGSTSASPVPSFTASWSRIGLSDRDKPLRPGQVVRLDGSASSDPDGRVAELRWDTDGDGKLDAEGPEATTTAGPPGELSVTLRVTDQEGVAASASRTLPIIENVAPTAAFGGPGGSPFRPRVNVPTTLSAAASDDPDGAVRTWRWDLDGQPGFERSTTEPTIEHTFPRAGRQHVRLQVRDDELRDSAVVAEDLTVLPAHVELEWVPRPGQASGVKLNPGAVVDTDVRLKRGPGATGPVQLVRVQDSAVNAELPSQVTGDAAVVGVVASPTTKEGKGVLTIKATLPEDEGATQAVVQIPFDVRPTVDAFLQGIEVTQGIQEEVVPCDLRAAFGSSPGQDALKAGCQANRSLPWEADQDVFYTGVPLVRGRKTVVRVFAAAGYVPSGATSPAYDVRLRGYEPGKNVPAFELFSMGGPQQLHGSAHEWVTFQRRTDDRGVFTFVLPKSLAAFRLEATLVGGTDASGEALVECAGCTGNNTFRLNGLATRSTGRIRLGMARLYTDGETVGQLRKDFHLIPSRHRGGLVKPADDNTLRRTNWPPPGFFRDFTLGMVPLADDGLVTNGSAYYAALDLTYVLKVAQLHGVDPKYMARAELDDVADASRDDCGGLELCGDQVMGVTASALSGGGVSKGSILGLQDPVAVSGLHTPVTFVHELVHGWGVDHTHSVGSCGDQTGTAVDASGRSYMNGVGLDLRGGLAGTSGQRPFHVLAPRSLGAGLAAIGVKNELDYYDVMSYCSVDQNESWASSGGWRQQVAKLQQIGQELKTLKQAASPTPSIEVAALDVPSGVQVLTASGRRRLDPAPPPGRYLLRAVDAAGATLSERPMHVEPLQDAPGAQVRGAVPARPAPAALVVLRDGTEVARRTVSARAPRVRVTAPAGGARLSARARELRVAWKASDADGGPLTATVAISLDGGRTFRPLGRTRDRSIVLPRAMVGGTRRARVRVTVSDGVREAVAESRAFTIAGLDPTATLVSPGARERVAAGGTLYLSGSAVDDRGVPVPARRMRWYVGRRRVGTGPRTSVTGLAPGTARVRLVVDDGRGGRTEARQAVRVTPAPARFRTLRVLRRPAARARTVAVRLSTTYPTTLRVGGRRFAVSPRARTLRLPVGRGMKAVGLRLGSGRTAAAATLTVRR